MLGSSWIDGRSEVVKFRPEHINKVQFHDDGFINCNVLLAGWVQVQKTLFSSHCIEF